MAILTGGQQLLKSFCYFFQLFGWTKEDNVSNEIVLYMYAVLVGLEIGRTICKSDEGIIISCMGMCGYTYLILFNNPGQTQLEEVMYVTCTLCAGIIATLCYVILWNEEEHLNNLYKEKDDEQGIRDPVQCSVSPQGIEEILRRQQRIGKSIAYPKGNAVQGTQGSTP